MKLPNAAQAVVEQEKIVEYLLNPTHPDNGGKAGFFTGLGFSASEWKILADALMKLAQTTEVTARAESAYGEKFVITGKLDAPGGISALVQTIWIVDKGSNVARLVTGYPRK